MRGLELQSFMGLAELFQRCLQLCGCFNRENVYINRMDRSEDRRTGTACPKDLDRRVNPVKEVARSISDAGRKFPFGSTTPAASEYSANTTAKAPVAPVSPQKPQSFLTPSERAQV